MRWGVNRFIIILNIMFGMVFGPSIFCAGVFLIWYLILFFFIFFINGFVLLYYIILVLILLRFAFGFKGKNLFNRAWVFFLARLLGGCLRVAILVIKWFIWEGGWLSLFI